jgi:ribosomal protein L37AE/L43A
MILGVFFRARREQRLTRGLLVSEAERVGPTVERLCREARAELDQIAIDVAALPGAAARCPSCEARMGLKRLKDKHGWLTLWVCPQCQTTVRPAEVPIEARAGGWT